MTEQDHTSRVREMAEMTVPPADSLSQKKRLGATGAPLDPRTAALRGEHEFCHGEVHRCVRCATATWETAYCLRTDADALDAVAAACGLTVIKHPNGHVYLLDDGNSTFRGVGDTPDLPANENLSHALYQLLIAGGK